MTKKIYTFDTTLRDGEQTPGVNLNEYEKVEIALQLEKLGIDIIEAGFAASSPGDLKAVRAVANAVKSPRVVSLARTSKGDIDAVRDAFHGIENVGIHIFIATSPIHMEKKLRMTKDQVLEQAIEAIKYASKYFDHIEFSCEDATRSDLDYLCEIAKQVILSGATVLNLPDTVGYTTPKEYAHLFRTMQERVDGIHKVHLSCHCHNDLGMAVSNTLAAIQEGATQVEGCINGIGERAGNVALEEVAMALDTRSDIFHNRTTMNLSEIAKSSKLISRLTGMPVPANKAIVGDNAFAHESGIHQDGMIKDKTTYEIMRPETIGLKESRLVLGKLSGRNALKEKLIELGYEVDDQMLKNIFMKFKELADKKKNIMDEDIVALLENRFAENDRIFYELDTMSISFNNHSRPVAYVRIRMQNGEFKETSSIGNGSVDALYSAIDEAIHEPIELVDYKIAAITRGTDALGEVFVRVRSGNSVIQGRGVSLDILEASARAYIDSINRMKNLESKKFNEVSTFA
jgi:2-isopropylmalate synthase